MTDSAQTATGFLAQAEAAYKSGQKEAAREASEQCLRLDVGEAAGWLILGALNRDGGRPFEAEACWLRALALDPERIEARFNLAQLMRSQRRRPEAVATYAQVVQRAPRYAPAWLGWCETLLEQGQIAEVFRVTDAARQAGCETADLWLVQGNAHFQRGAFALAVSAYRQVLQLAPLHLSARYNLALALSRDGQRQAAIAELRTLLAQAPQYLNAHIKLADLLAESGDPLAAALAYRAAIALKPDMGELHNNLGKALRQTGQIEESIACFERALALGIVQPVVYLNLGGAWQTQRQQEKALAAYRRGLAIEPDNFSLLTSAVHVQQMLCDWQGFDHLHTRLVLPALPWRAEALPPPCFPFLALPVEVSAAEQRQIADNYARHLSQNAGPQFQHAPWRELRRPLRIGYVSADFHNHATAHLMLGLFRRHDRQRVEVWAYSMGADDGSHYRQRIVADCDRFIDIGALSDDAAAARIQADGIDIVVDLKGYTGSARPAIFARRPAPIQVQYLGYPGTMGGDCFDYVIADKVVLPEADIPHFCEAPVWMPHCYQINDIEQPIAAQAPSRSECGLPEQGFVFCCFNSPYKIEPRIFSAWMRLLAAVPEAVLWLYAGNATAVANRKAEAAARGIAPARLVFADMLPKDQHLARHRHADLFLDTLYYNAHTTGSDALWAGVPMLTLPGRTFASRVGESLLCAVGLPELIVPDLDHYLARAIELAQHPGELAALKARLAANRLTCPLFDTEKFTRGLEYAYAAMADRRIAGLPPAPITVPDFLSDALS